MASVPMLNKVGTEGARSSGSSEAGSGTPTADPNQTTTINHNGNSNHRHSNEIHSRSTAKSDSSGSNGERFEYSGWVYHLGVNSIGHEYCHFRFLLIRGKYVEMYKRDPSENPGIVRAFRFCSAFTWLLQYVLSRFVLIGLIKFDCSWIMCCTVADQCESECVYLFCKLDRALCICWFLSSRGFRFVVVYSLQSDKLED